MKAVSKLSRKRVKCETADPSHGDKKAGKNTRKLLFGSLDLCDSSPEFQPKRETKLPLNLPRENFSQVDSVKSIVTDTESTDAESQSTGDDGEVIVVEEKRMCAGCCKFVVAATYNSHLHHCLKRFKSISTVEECSECKLNLKGLSKIRKKEHVERCKRLASESDSSTQSRQIPSILDCPFCGKYSVDPLWRETHMKKCAKSKHYSLEEYERAIRLQEKQVQEKVAAGLPAGPAKPVVATKTASRNTRPVAEPITYHQEDLQMAKAMSLSLAQEEKIQRDEDDFVFQTVKIETRNLDETLRRVLEEKTERRTGKRNKTRKTTPLLMLRSVEDRANIIAERAAEILSETRKEYILKTCGFYVNWREVKVKRNWISNLGQSRLWKLSAQTDELVADPNCYYTSAFLEHEVPVHFDASKSRHRRISLVPGYKLMSNELVEEDKDFSLATQDIVAQLYNQNNQNLIMDNSENANISFCVKRKDEEMGDGFFTQIRPDDSKKCLKMSDDLLKMVGNSTLSDVTVHVESDITIPCHRFILLCRCPEAYKELHKIYQANEQQYILDWKTISYGGAIAFLKYLYGEVKPDDCHMDEIAILARRYEIQEFLTNEFERHLSYTEEDNSYQCLPALSVINENSEPECVDSVQQDISDVIDTVSPNPPLKTLYSNFIKDELHISSQSVGSGSSSPLLFDLPSQIRKSGELGASTTNLMTKCFSLESNQVTNFCDAESDFDSDLPKVTSSNVDTLSVESDAFQVKLNSFLSSTQATLVTSTPESDSVLKRKSSDDSDLECFASLRKRLKMKEDIKTQANLNVTVELEMENEEPDLIPSPYAPAGISNGFDIEQDNIYSLEKSPEYSSNDNLVVTPHLSQRRATSTKKQSNFKDSEIIPSQLEKQSRKKHTKEKKQKATTPIPRYSIMETPEIAKELKKIGVRNLGKKKGVNLLKHVFKETHKKSDTDEPDNSSSVCSSQESAEFSATQSLPSSNKETKSPQDKDKSKEIMAFLKNNKDLYTEVLLLKTIVIEDFHKKLTDEGIKCSINQLKDFLDSECVTFKSAEEKGRRRRTVKSRIT
ncbi:5'-flap endonuclease [Chamberlinius hualienensis]